MKIETYNTAVGLIGQRQDLGILKRNWDEDIFIVIETGKWEADKTKRKNMKILLYNPELKDKFLKVIEEHYEKVTKEFEEL